MLAFAQLALEQIATRQITVPATVAILIIIFQTRILHPVVFPATVFTYAIPVRVPAAAQAATERTAPALPVIAKLATLVL